MVQSNDPSFWGNIEISIWAWIFLGLQRQHRLSGYAVPSAGFMKVKLENANNPAADYIRTLKSLKMRKTSVAAQTNK